MPKPPMTLVKYDDLRSDIRNGDLLLWRPTSLLGRAICLGTSIGKWRWVRHSHASMAARGPNGRVYALEMMQWVGGRHHPLSEQVRRYPLSCEVWRPVSPDFDGDGAVRHMLWLMGQHYGWRSFARIAVRNLLPHMILPKRMNSDDPDQSLVCSGAYAWAAARGGGVPPLPNKLDIEISPADLALSGFARYLATPFL